MACTTYEEQLARRIWEHWKQTGTQSNMTYLEVLNLTAHLTKICRNSGLDYQNFDLQATLDASLTYEENLTVIDQMLGIKNFDDKEYMFNVACQSEKELKSLETLETENIKLAQQHKKYLERIKKLEQQLKQQQQQPPKQDLPVKVQRVECEYNAYTAPYSDAELAEIQDYLQKRGSNKNVCLHNVDVNLMRLENKICAATSKATKKIWSFAKWVLI